MRRLPGDGVLLLTQCDSGGVIGDCVDVTDAIPLERRVAGTVHENLVLPFRILSRAPTDRSARRCPRGFPA